MDNVDLQVLRQVATWRAQGERVVLGTITRTWGSAPRAQGSYMAVSREGAFAGCRAGVGSVILGGVGVACGSGGFSSLRGGGGGVGGGGSTTRITVLAGRFGWSS